MTDPLIQHDLTETFFELTLLFQLEMQQKAGSSPLFYQGQGNILMALGEKDGQSQKELARRLQISAPSVTEFVTKLVKKGLVRKQRAAADHRITEITLTTLGRQSLNQVQQTDLTGWDLLSDKQQKKLSKLLHQVLTGMQAQYSDQTSKAALASMKQQFLKHAAQAN